MILPGQMVQAQAVPAQAVPAQVGPAQAVPAQVGPYKTDGKPGIPRIDAGKGSDRGDGGNGTVDPRILHMLNRFTFGATPEEIADVRAMGSKGLDRWFEEQLQPDDLRPTSGDVYLETQLAALPALNLPVDELLGTFPSRGVIRQAADGKVPMPEDPSLYAIYRRHIELYQDKKAEKQADVKSEKPPAMTNGPGTGGPGTGTAAENAAGAKDGVALSGMAGPDSAGNAGPGNAAPGNTASANTAVEPKPAAKDGGRLMAAASPELRSGEPDGRLLKSGDKARVSYSELLVKGVLALPPAERVSRVLGMQPGEYEQFRSALKGPQKLELLKGLDPQDRELLTDFDNPTRTVVEELEAQRLLRDIYSSHQLQEVMTTFWLNHFNVFLHKNDETPYYLVSYERDVIRPNALGNFENLLVATAESPAMLLYLDNASSTGPASEVAARQKQHERYVAAPGKAPKAAPGLNENYARELMELHTLGVNGGYTQADVTEVAKVFTGWTVDRPQLGGDFKFDDARHEPGTKVVMGHKIKEHGVKEGLQLLHILATSPATAHFISQELAVAFVSDNPPATLVDRMARSFEKNDGEISEVLRTMVHSPEFWAASTYQAKVKTPLEYVVSAARASGAEIVNIQPLVNALNTMGMPLYGCVPPTGYSLKADAWVSTGELVDRMNFALSLATKRFVGIDPQWYSASRLGSLNFRPPEQSPAEAEKSLEAVILPGGVSEKTRATVIEQAQQDRPDPLVGKPAGIGNPDGGGKVQAYGAKPMSSDEAKAAGQAAAGARAQERLNGQIAGLLLGSPEFQRR
jgi:uncharacterized protein (DUF1800 family)